MSDIDFDELDKAVNTLMGDVPKVAPLKSDDIKTLTINSTIADDSRPSLDKLDSTLAAVNGVAAKPADKTSAAPVSRIPTVPLATRRGGRFMDVVRPSSAMTSGIKTTASRQGVTIHPTANQPAQATDDQSGDVRSVDGFVSQSKNSLTASFDDNALADAERVAVKNDWPDPLETSGYGSDADTTDSQSGAEYPDEVTVEGGADNTIQESTASAATDYEETSPMSSPFITDAKVDKRPLGGTPVEVPGRAPVLGVLAAEDAHGTDVAHQLPATPDPIEVHLPPELQSDLMAIETDVDAATPDTATTEPAPVKSTQQSTSTESINSPVARPVAVAAEVIVPTGPTSIPQQYHEEPSTSDEPGGSIYDMDSYHQPVAHPAKTKSGWLWVMWILLLLVVGGGGAVALYFIGVI
ncbi:MAG TPA: hypothetical protein VGO98_03145 [Candidatus Saccharimonadales bacterium]|jgi:hypothetical protein|nr:hypothetical protein [Candidatus Saccharimonadales bacterium]